jgi:glycerol-3-phosphate dehydrogenase
MRRTIGMTERYDIVVIGGGIHGVGVAQSAACHGHPVLLLEKTGLAAGTSSRSSKLIHGGLRYLEGLDFSLVRESLRERAILRKIAPHLVQLQPFLIPVYAGTKRRPLIIRTGLTLYALLGNLHKANRFRKLHRREWDQLDGLSTDGLQAVYRYFDAQTNDAELTRAIMQSAIDLGAVLGCPCEFIAANVDPGGCEVRYRQAGVDKTCHAGVLVNAAGPWINRIAERIDPSPPRFRIDLVQGAHLVMQGGLNHGCYYLEVPEDRRGVFLLPWYEHSLLGTTENLFTGEPENVRVLDREVDYLLAAMGHYFPHRSRVIIDRFAGLRVLPAAESTPFERSREIRLSMDNPERPRVVSIYGGKLTGYRLTAEKIMRHLQRTLPARKPVADTASLKLPG